MSRTDLLTITRTCTFCGVESEAKAPFSNYDRVSDEACELSESDLVQTRECDNCHQTEYLYWHNTLREQSLTEDEIRLYRLKSKAYSEFLAVMALRISLRWKPIHAKFDYITSQKGNNDLFPLDREDPEYRQKTKHAFEIVKESDRLYDVTNAEAERDLKLLDEFEKQRFHQFLTTPEIAKFHKERVSQTKSISNEFESFKQKIISEEMKSLE